MLSFMRSVMVGGADSTAREHADVRDNRDWIEEARSHAAVAAEVVAGRLVAWVSVDPRSGRLFVYPAPVATRLEAAWRAGGPQEVSLSGLGGGDFYETAFVDMGDRARGRWPTQKTSTGRRRDVRRVEIPPEIAEAAEDPEVILHVKHDRGWRIADVAIPGVTEEQRVVVPEPQDVCPPIGSSASASREPRTPTREPRDRTKSDWSAMLHRQINPEELELREAFVQQCPRGYVAIWEWCKAAEARDINAVSVDSWGMYGEEHSKIIEDSFRRGDAVISINIGIRSYTIAFDAVAGHGRQIDVALKKRRFVRRTMVSVAERAASLEAAAAALEAMAEADEECAVCYATFGETPTLPAVVLPCNHRFHGVCVQQLADKGGPCPCCRAEVNWRAILKGGKASWSPKTNSNSVRPPPAVPVQAFDRHLGAGPVRVQL